MTGAFSMFSEQENEILTHTGPDTPMGRLIRRYWIPALRSDEVAEPDGARLRLRLLSEDLIVFRDTQGRIGVLDQFCPHRRSSLFFARNEECGLRCAYHGWKFDVHGNVIEILSEPDFDRWKTKTTNFTRQINPEIRRAQHCFMPFTRHAPQV